MVPYSFESWEIQDSNVGRLDVWRVCWLPSRVLIIHSLPKRLSFLNGITVAIRCQQEFWRGPCIQTTAGSFQVLFLMTMAVQGKTSQTSQVFYRSLSVPDHLLDVFLTRTFRLCISRRKAIGVKSSFHHCVPRIYTSLGSPGSGTWLPRSTYWVSQLRQYPPLLGIVCLGGKNVLWQSKPNEQRVMFCAIDYLPKLSGILPLMLLEFKYAT